jgi:hypothetical protein
MGFFIIMQYVIITKCISKVFAGSRGGFFKKSPWPPEAKENCPDFVTEIS